MNRQDFRSFTRIEVRWAEVDAQKIVFNAHYLMYADVAITHYWRQLAIPYEAGFAALGGELAGTPAQSNAVSAEQPRLQADKRVAQAVTADDPPF